MSDLISDAELKTPNLAPGIYKHYKGNRYEVVGVALHTETNEPLVVYLPLYESHVSYWVRPYAMFMSTVIIDGQIIPRFKKVADHE